MTPAPVGLRARLRLMVLTDPEPASGLGLGEVVERALAAGATAIQLRHEGAPGGVLLEEARELLEVVRPHGALFLVNDRFDVALAAGADGVHLGPEDPPVEAVRAQVPEGFLLGYSADDPEEAREAAAAGASYLGVGSVYGTASKQGLEEERVGPARVGEVLRAAGLPGVGIGGVTPENARPIYETGAGVAVLSAVTHADRPGEAVRALLAASEVPAWRAPDGPAGKRG